MRPDLDKYIAALDEKVPLSSPVTLNFLPVIGKLGTSWFDSKAECFVVTLTPLYCDHALDSMVEALKHEWAHCKTDCECTDEHCDHWGAAFAQCTRAILTLPCGSPG
jgi:hypothetical protein